MNKIFIPTPLRKFTGEQAQVEVQADTVSDALRQLAQKYPELDQHLYNADHTLRQFVRVFIGDQDIRQLDGTDTALRAGDDVSIIPAIAGGLHD